MRPAVRVYVGISGLVAACGGSSAGSPAAPPDATVGCPATLEETVGRPCATAGLRCGPRLACGTLELSILCVCTDGIFQCTDGTGNGLDAATSIECPEGSPIGSCPSTERSAELSTCGEPGLQCAYPSACPGRFDTCQCFPGATANGAYGLRFECVPLSCGGVDGGVPILESGTNSDALVPVDSGEAGASPPDAYLDSNVGDSGDGGESGVDARLE